MSAGDFDMEIPADFIISILSSAPPLPPDIIAPACPILRPGGAVSPAIKPTIGFFVFSFLIKTIAGTRKRGANEEEDKNNEKDLLNDPKELAEHLMLIDLGRNDVGRVSEIGSVKLTEKMVIERYSHVMHIVSNVVGKLSKGLNFTDALKATLPAGTLSGAPKIRAMEIINELEPSSRGIYGGAIGYISWNGNIDTAIAIRTAVIRDNKIHVGAGAGIVADSDPEKEWEECVQKSKVFLDAMEMIS